jgi:hypothetical protein
MVDGKPARGPLALLLGAGLLLAASAPAAAASAVSCGGAAMLGGAQLACSHVDAKAPAQFCTFSWALVTAANVSQVVEGSFLLLPKASNVQVYQGSGFTGQLSAPIILCQGSKART